MHGSKPLTWNKISEISQWQKCCSQLKISNPRISCTLNGVRRSSWKVVRVTKSSYASETSFKWQIFCSYSWRAMDTCWQDKFDIKLCLDRFYLLANFSGIVFWYFDTLLCLLLKCASCVNKSSIFWFLFQKLSLALSPTCNSPHSLKRCTSRLASTHAHQSHKHTLSAIFFVFIALQICD